MIEISMKIGCHMHVSGRPAEWCRGDNDTGHQGSRQLRCGCLSCTRLCLHPGKNRFTNVPPTYSFTVNGKGKYSGLEAGLSIDPY